MKNKVFKIGDIARDKYGEILLITDLKSNGDIVVSNNVNERVFDLEKSYLQRID